MDPNPVPVPKGTSPQLPVTGQKEKVHGVRPRMVLAHPEADYAERVSRHFRRLGWEVHLAPSGQEARRLARLLAPAAVILGADLPDETGWLTCKKLLDEQPGLRVILVGAISQGDETRFAAFVGAAGWVCQADGAPALVDELYGTTLAAAC